MFVDVGKEVIIADFLLFQSYYEEMLNKSPRKKVFNDYARQLQRRYPSMKEEISIRIQHVNNQWQALETAISPLHGYHDQQTILSGIQIIIYIYYYH